ncbi:MAG TPA: two-component regulator propeller domain-containing protein [Verrucomicrobiae bacterium]
MPKSYDDVMRRLWIILIAMSVVANGRAAVLWRSLGSTLAHETGDGRDILEGAVKRDDTASDALYFKFHVDPLSDASTEEYFAGFELYDGGEERLGIGNALEAWAYSAFRNVVNGDAVMSDYVNLHTSRPERSSGTNSGEYQPYELPHQGLENTIVFKVQYIAGGDDEITIWLNPDLGPGASEASQPANLITRLDADASFDEIRLRHGGGGNGWIFGDMEIATSFVDFAAPTTNASRTKDFGTGTLPFTFHSWQREQGLPQNFVRALAQTRDGFVWVGSDDGVARFDGLRFVPFGLREGLNSGPVKSLLGDSAGALWIGGAAGGLTRYEHGHFVVISNVPAGAILTLAEDHQKQIWIGGETGLAIWKNGQIQDVPRFRQFSGKTVTALAADSHNAMWIAVKNNGVFVCNGATVEKISDPSLERFLEDPHCLLVDHQGRLWVGAGGEFLLYLEKGRWYSQHIHPHQGEPYVSALAETPDGTVWAATVGEGVLQFKNGAMQEVGARSGLSDNLAESLLVDQQGVLWVGTHGGLNRLRAQTVLSFGAMEGLGYGAVQGLAEFAPGEIWAGKPNGGIYRWEGPSFRRLSNLGLSLAGPINALLRARDGSCWIAGESALVHFADPRAISRPEVAPFAKDANVIALAEDAEGGLWVGTRDGRLWRRWHNQWFDQPDPWREHAIAGIVFDRDGSVLVGTSGAGLYRMRGGKIIHYGKAGGLVSELIRTLYLDRAGALWIGTEGGGLSVLRGEKISTFTTRQGLPDNTISQILEDDFGCLWLGSNRGIACVSERELEALEAGKAAAVYAQVYARDEGLPSEECTAGFFPAGLRTHDGLLWFSTLKGIVVIDPRRRPVDTLPPSVVLDEVTLDGQSVAVSAEPALHVGPGKHRLEFTYTAMGFDDPERLRFRYRLEPLDPDWFDAGARRTAPYPFVPPGDYRFLVSASLGGENWGQPTATLGIVVAHYFWQSWWFLTVVLAIILGSVAGLSRIVEKRKMQHRLRQLEQEKVLERERTRIAQDLHDEMGAKLCRISFLSEDARRVSELPANLRSQISSISDVSREVLHSLDEIVWAVNPRNDSLEPVASYIGQYAQDYFQETGIQCELDIPAQLPFYPLSSHLRHHLFHAVHEALTNALKHSKATHLKVSVKCEDSAFEIAASDNGAGFDSALLAGPFISGNGLRNMRERLSEMGGRCHIESMPGRGTTVRFVIPMNGQHHGGAG